MGNFSGLSTSAFQPYDVPSTGDRLPNCCKRRNLRNCGQGGDARIRPIGLLTSVWNGTERTTRKPAQTQVDWKTVVEQIRAGDPAGGEVLYRNLASGARLFLRRRLATQDVEDRVHD